MSKIKFSLPKMSKIKFSRPPSTFATKRDRSAFIAITFPLVIVTGLALGFQTFIWQAIVASKTINFSIIGTATIGAVLILNRFIDTKKDFRIIERFRHEVLQGNDMKAVLGQPWLKRRYVRHYLGHIANTRGILSSDLEHSLIKSELDTLRENYESRLELPQFIVGFMIAMGLLGTFVGLLATLTGIAGMLDEMGNSTANIDDQFKLLIIRLRDPISGMGTAFSASMFGLITSLMLSIMMTNLRRYVSRFLGTAHNITFELIQIVEESSNKGNVSFGIPDNDHGGFSVERNALLAGKLDMLSKRIEGLITSFGDYTENTRRLNDLLGVGPRMKETAEKSLDAMLLLATSQTEQHRQFQSLISANTEMLRKLDDILSVQRQLSSNNQHGSALLLDVNTNALSLASTLLDSQRQAHGDVVTLLQSLSNQMIAIKDVDLGGMRHLNDIREKLTKLCDSAPVIESVASGINDQSNLIATSQTDQQRQLQSLITANTDMLRNLNDIREKLGKLCDSAPVIELVASGINDQSNLIATSQTDQQRQLQSLITANTDMLRKLDDILSVQRQLSSNNQHGSALLLDVNTNAVSLTSTLLDSQKEAHGELVTQMQSLSNHMISIKEVDIGGTRHLNDIKEKLTKLCDTTPVMELVASSVSEQSALFATLIDEIRRTQQALLMINNGLARKNNDIA